MRLGHDDIPVVDDGGTNGIETLIDVVLSVKDILTNVEGKKFDGSCILARLFLEVFGEDSILCRCCVVECDLYRVRAVEP